MQEIIYNIISSYEYINNTLDNKLIILEYLSHIPFDIMNLDDHLEFINEFDYNIDTIKDKLSIFNKY